MNQLNAIIRIETNRLNFPLHPLHARMGHSFAAQIVGAPDDVLGLFVRIFKADGSYFDFPANERPDGVYLVYIIGTAFPSVCETMYEIHANDAHGNPTALGRGVLTVHPFSVTSTPITPGSTVTVAQVPTADGAMVQIRMVQDSVGEWVYEAVTPNGGAE